MTSDNTLTRERQFYAEIAALRKEVAAIWRERSEFAKRIDEADADLARVTAERDALAAELAALKANDPLAREEIDRLRAEVAALKAERDEARRWYCRSTAQREYTIYLPSANEIDKTARSVAIRFGWDCFEEVKP